MFDPIYIIIITLVLSLVVIFFGTTYHDLIITGFQHSAVVEVFYYWLLGLSILTIMGISLTMYVYQDIKNKRGPPGPRGERGRDALVSEKGFTRGI